jgi:hypothetical protein
LTTHNTIRMMTPYPTPTITTTGRTYSLTQFGPKMAARLTITKTTAIMARGITRGCFLADPPALLIVPTSLGVGHSAVQCSGL